MTASPSRAAAHPPSVRAPAALCGVHARASRLAWLETDGTGGCVMGTVAGTHTHRHHGLLAAAAPPRGAEVV